MFAEGLESFSPVCAQRGPLSTVLQATNRAEQTLGVTSSSHLWGLGKACPFVKMSDKRAAESRPPPTQPDPLLAAGKGQTGSGGQIGDLRGDLPPSCSQMWTPAGQGEWPSIGAPLHPAPMSGCWGAGAGPGSRVPGYLSQWPHSPPGTAMACWGTGFSSVDGPGPSPASA